MKQFYIFILLGGCFLVFSCKHDNRGKTKEINSMGFQEISISTSENKPVMNFDQLIEDVKIIPLETSPGSLVGAISKVQIKKDKIYIFDFDIDKGVTIFT